jgi:hypothetical protein
VSTGQLSEEAYSKQMKAKIEEERELAKRMLRAGLRNRAEEAVKRVKIMQKELELMAQQ